MRTVYLVTIHRIESNEWEFEITDTKSKAIEIATQSLEEYYDNVTPQDGTYGMIKGYCGLKSYLGENLGLLDVQIHEKTLNKK